ncbi:MAG: polysaccharide deacetylase family protein [Pseudomonadota bacterium]|nr:polysaccharide deacetylase family protein [Pseudomonadota bacterium]
MPAATGKIRGKFQRVPGFMIGRYATSRGFISMQRQLVRAPARLKRLLQLTAIVVTYYTGALWLYTWLALRGRAVVLTYHRVLPSERQRNSFSSNAIVVTPETFELHLKFIRRFLRPVTPVEFMRRLCGGEPIESRTCLVTFDDGWYDNMEYALPLLRKYGVPAVLFVPTDFPGGDRYFWYDRLSRLLFYARQHHGVADDLLERLGAREMLTMNERDARQAIRSIISNLRSLPESAIHDAIQQLQSALSRARPDLCLRGEDYFLTWQQLGALSKSEVFFIGSHAVTHTAMTEIDLERVSEELLRSKAEIKQRLEVDPALFAYPNGNVNAQIADRVRDAGYALAFTTEVGFVSKGCSPWLLRRINMFEYAAASRRTLLARIAGLN